MGTSQHKNNNYKNTFECHVSTAEFRRPTKRQNRGPLSCVTVGYIQSKQNQTHNRLRVLLDSGCTATLINKKFVRTFPTTKTNKVKWRTKTGVFKTTRKCDITFTLPAFHENRQIQVKAYVDESHAHNNSYDLIIGRDLLLSLGIDLKFSTGEMEWDNATVDMPQTEELSKNWSWNLEKEILLMHDPETTEAERIQSIIDQKYTPADLDKVVNELTHLSQKEKRKLLTLLNKYKDLFDGQLGTWNTKPIELELKEPNCKPYHAKPYPVPRSQEQKLKQEVERLCKYEVLREINDSEWASPMFTIPKPDGSLRSLADLRELNKRIKRKPFPLPKIQDMLLKLEGFMFATSLDLNMGYYHILLSPNSRRLCTIVLPWGKYEYLRLPMGLCNSPDIFQEKMNQLMKGLQFCQAYIDDLLVLSRQGGLDQHLNNLEQVFSRLQEAGLKVNISKSHFCQTELKYLGYIINRQGIKPDMKKVQSILQIERPHNRRSLRKFLGLVNYYRDMWPRRSHFLAPLSSLVSINVRWNWSDECQKAFTQIKSIIAKETLLAYPDFSKPFEIHTDASKVQLGAVISQEGKPIAFYTRKLNPAQTRYTTTERELLSIVECFKEFRNILLGQQIIVYTDHENLTYKNHNSDRVMRWRLYIEEYAPDLRYIKGENNVVADALSRLPLMDKDPDKPNIQEAYFTFMECFANKTKPNLDHHPLSYKHLQNAQHLDPQIRKILQMDNTQYYLKDFHGGGKTWSLVCFKEKIVVPKLLQKHILIWYHTTLCHPGINRTEETIGQHLWWPKMREQITAYVKACPSCQRNKRKIKKYGHLPPKEAESIPWDKMCIDLIGPYKIRRKGKKDLVCRCVTMIDPATGWFEIKEYDDKKSITVANIAEQEWFCRYPWPTQITYDRGSEFIGKDFQKMIKEEYGVTRKPITVQNPQANAIVEQIHQVIGNII